MNHDGRPADAAALGRLLSAYRYNFANESDLQRGIARVLDRAGVAYERELALGDGDIIDFLVDGAVGCEVKVAGSYAAVVRQLHRYCRHEQVRSLLLVTTRGAHRMPGSLLNKPLVVLNLSLAGGAF